MLNENVTCHHITCDIIILFAVLNALLFFHVKPRNSLKMKKIEVFSSLLWCLLECYIQNYQYLFLSILTFNSMGFLLIFGGGDNA